MQKRNILIADDEPDLLEILKEYLEEFNYKVDTCNNGEEALLLLESNKYDLLLSDINMPKMKGFELLHRAKKKYPSLKTVLFTAYNVNDYIQFAKKEGVGNIIPKSSPLNLKEILMIITKLINGNIFGLSHHMNNISKTQEIVIKHSNNIDMVIDTICKMVENEKQKRKLNLILREVITNAIFYGAKNEKGDEKEKWETSVSLEEDEFVKINFASNDKRIGVSVMDQKGRLTKEGILYWLDRNITRDENNLPVSNHDIHGRGIFISRESAEKLIVNIQKSKQTEIIILCTLMPGTTEKENHPLLINEI